MLAFVDLITSVDNRKFSRDIFCVFVADIAMGSPEAASLVGSLSMLASGFL